MKVVSPVRVRFGAFELDLRSGELHGAGRTIHLQEKSFRLLRTLLERRGEVATREEIRKQLWPNDTIVDFEHGINTATRKLRSVLGDSAEDPKYIETLAGRGYRLLVDVEWVGGAGTAADSSSSTPTISAKPGERLGHPPDSDALDPDPKAGLSISVGSARDDKRGARGEKLSESGGLIGRKVSHYRVLEVIGGGGMGVVYKAEDLKLGRAVALKFLPEELGNDAKALERFEREARAASALDHPNICSIYEFGEHEGQPFIVMQLLEGQTLRDRLTVAREGGCVGQPFPVDQLLDIAIQVAHGLEAAHEKGIVHRDIKPANIFLTNKGVAKIVDFGVAKLTNIGEDAADNLPIPGTTARPSTALCSAPDDEFGTAKAAPLPTVERALTRTGVALGTVGYMSPEQVRREKLDERTDLFSFGLVLYEMATGQRAFSAETSAILHDAILNSTPVPVHDLNASLPPKLELVINKAIEKERGLRFESAAKLRKELELLIVPRRREAMRPRVAVALAGLVALLLIVLTGTLVFVSPRRQSAPLEIKETQLTSNSPENQVQGGAISPDGKHMAFYDMKGLHIKSLESGATADIPDPQSLKDAPTDWELAPLSNTKFLATAHILGQGASVWAISIAGGEPKKIRENAQAGAASPDGSSIAFLTNKGPAGYREIWVMDAAGDGARKIATADLNSDFQDLDWSPNGRRLVYRRDYPANDKLDTILESRDLDGGAPAALLSDNTLWTYKWLPDGRLIYVLLQRDITSSSCDFWQMRVDPDYGTPLEPARHLTHWAGFCVGDLSATADGNRLVSNKWWVSTIVFVADFDKTGKSRLVPRRLNFSDSQEYPVAWTADSQQVVFLSRHTGKWGLFRQAPGDERVQTIAEDAGGLVKGSISPDGQWILFLCCQNPTTWEPLRLLRVRITGGTPQVVLSLSTAPEPVSNFSGRYFQPPGCSKSPARLCVIVERTQDGRQLVFTSFDPMTGRGPELLRYNIDPISAYKWDLSPDGKRIAIFRRSEDRIHIVYLNGRAPEEMKVKGWKVLQAVYWAPDGRSLFVSSVKKSNSVLLYVSANGEARELWDLPGEQDGGTDAYAVPSPDGRHLAIRGWSINSNMWMLEKF
jgi:serine/threonine protein kinase/DNA-binding winged helix-turn-helix (wHTH) protein